MKHLRKVHPTPIVAEPVKEYRPSSVLRNGHVVKTLEVVTTSLQETFASLHAEDYELDNILAIGATDMLRPSSISRDNLEADMASVEAFDAAVNAAQQKKPAEPSKPSDPSNTSPSS